MRLWVNRNPPHCTPVFHKKKGQLNTRTLFRLFIGILILSVAGSSCKTTKRKGDLSPLGKFYHNTTAEYNGYFNADVLMIESIFDLELQHQDNYNKILPLYKYREASNPKAVAEKLDRAIEKTSIVVALHRYSNWTDDCYLLIGQAEYLKQDFEAAEETLEYMVSEFKPSTLKKSKSTSKVDKKKKPSKSKKKRKKNSRKRKKKPSSKRSSSTSPKEEEIELGVTKISLGDNKVQIEEGKPQSYLFKHRPAYQEGLLWLAKTYIERENYFEADRIIYQLTKNASTFPYIRRDLSVVEAYYYLKQKRLADAIAPLERAVELTKDRVLKARYTYILGQIYQRLDKNAMAVEAFQQVVKLKPGYEMDFSARLNLTKMSWAKSGGSMDSARKDLERMLKDIKNIEYQDQIYYAMAEIDLREGNKEQAIQNLRKSLASSNSSGSTAQKAEAYYTLANLYFESEKFVETKKYLDSTLMVLPNTDERYPQVSKLASNLTDIAKNLEIIQLQDSLLALSQMSEEEQFAMATEIKKAQDEARRKALLESAKNDLGGRPGISGNNGGPKAGALKSDFFAYDDRAVKRGLKEFERKWGTRPLEDNWRRKSTSFGLSAGEEDIVSQETGSSALTKEEVDAIFRDVPKSPDAIEAANKKIMEAMFALGRLYREKLNHEVRAIASLEGLLDRYPETPYRPEALYLLYLAYTDSGKTSDAKRCYDLLTAEFPDSPYALMLTDPDFLRKTKDREQRINQYYNEVYAVFQRGQYKDAFERINKAPDMFGGNNSHTPRFELLKAMCLGNIDGKGAYVAALKDLIERFPTAPEQKQARELLRLLGEYTASGPGGTAVKPEEETYVFEPEDKHYIIVVFKGNIALETAKVEMADYHIKYHKLDKLRVSNIYLGDIDDRTPIVVVRSFDDRNKAMEYLEGVEANKQDFLTAEFDYQVFPISQNNYRQMLKNKVIDGYPEFFKKNYE